jgi:hypothetical protein
MDGWRITAEESSICLEGSSLKDPFIRALTRATRHPERAPSERDRMARPTNIHAAGFTWVVLHRHLIDSEFNRFARTADAEERHRAPFQAVERLTVLLGEPLAVEGPMVIWALEEVPPAPPQLAPTVKGLTTRTWERPEPTAYEARLHELGRIP